MLEICFGVACYGNSPHPELGWDRAVPNSSMGWWSSIVLNPPFPELG